MGGCFPRSAIKKSGLTGRLCLARRRYCRLSVKVIYSCSCCLLGLWHFHRRLKKQRRWKKKSHLCCGLNVQKVTEAGKHSHHYRCGEIVFFFSRLRTSWNVKETMTKMTEECLRTAVSFSSQLNLFFFFFCTAFKGYAWLWVSEHFIRNDCEWSRSWSYTTELRLPSTWKQRRKDGKNITPSVQVNKFLI